MRIGADASASNANATVFSNASLIAGRDVTMVAGQDLSLIGANVSGANVTLDAGRDLLLISQQNQSTSNSWSFDVSVTIGPGGVPTGGSLAGSFSNGARTYTDTPTAVIAGDRLDVYVGRTTVLAGAGMWSKTGKLKLDTNDLVFDNYSNKDTYVAVSAGLSIDTNANHPWDGNLSVQYRNTRGLTFATLGAGDINVRARPKLDLSGLNRDVANVTRVTSSTSWSFTIPALNLAKLADDLKLAANYVNALTTQLPKSVQERGERAVSQWNTMLLNGASRSVMYDFVASGAFDEDMRARATIEAARRIGHEPSVAELALVMQLEGVVYKMSDAGEVRIEFTCPQQGVCGYVLSEFMKMFPDKQRQDAVLKQLSEAWTPLSRIMTGTNGDWVYADTVLQYFGTMLRCAYDEPDVFRKFVGLYPDALPRMAKSFGNTYANIEAINGLIIAANAPGATKETIRTFYLANFSTFDQLTVAHLYSIVQIRYLTSTATDWTIAAFNGDPVAIARAKAATTLAMKFAEYVKDHPGEVAEGVLDGVTKQLAALKNGDADAIYALVETVVLAKGAAFATERLTAVAGLSQAEAAAVTAEAERLREAVAAATSEPWYARLNLGRAFNKSQWSKYEYNELYIKNPNGGYYILDSYSVSTPEIVSRKFTQLSEVQESTAKAYINEILTKYPAGATIADVASSSRDLAGRALRGQYILEIPVQSSSVAHSIIEYANARDVIIRDIAGRIYK